MKERKPIGYWTEENTIIELKLVTNELGHFPTGIELKNMNKRNLGHAITKNGGYPYFRKIFGYELKRKPDGYWTEENTIIELKLIIKELSHFPTQRELYNMNRSDLVSAMRINGGSSHFRKKMRYKPLQKPDGYWTEENTIIELEANIKELGHFPTYTELENMNRSDLERAITINGGVSHFKEILGYETKKRKHIGYWTEENTIIELEAIIEVLGHFPTYSEFENMKRRDLHNAIKNNGGLPHFWKIFGIEVTERQILMSKIASYVGKRGKECEIIVKDLLMEWTEAHNLPSPEFNVKLAKSKIIEFVCEGNKRIGIDVTNTKSKNGGAIRHKWKHKEYQNHLDELWIVVFSFLFTPEDFIKLNQKSPDSVKVMSIWQFIEELELIPDEDYKDKMGNYCKCTFHNKDELVKNISERGELSNALRLCSDKSQA
ncbi:MAG: hypothetical protein KAS66_02030 [Candidatus Omnitrophica bacterium]|nr:hypothetical protein [Candidatus Omnitrophota bacterium]